MPQRINVYLPDDLHRAVEAHRGRLNVSRICQEALAKEVSRLETAPLAEGSLPSLAEGEREAVASRLRAERERRDTFWYAAGYRAAFEWARDRGDHEAVAALAAGRALHADSNPGWLAGIMHGGSAADAVAARTWSELRREVGQALERAGRVPRQDVTAFSRGVRDGAKAVWDAVRDDVIGPDEPGGAGEDPCGERAGASDPPAGERSAGTGR